MRLLRTVLAGGVLLVACSGPTPASPQIGLELHDGSITTSNGRFQVGAVEISAVNVGEFPHTVVVTDESGAVRYASDLIPPGTTLSTNVELEAGRFEISCRIVTRADDGTISDHYEQGMVTTIES